MKSNLDNKRLIQATLAALSVHILILSALLSVNISVTPPSGPTAAAFGGSTEKAHKSKTQEKNAILQETFQNLQSPPTKDEIEYDVVNLTARDESSMNEDLLEPTMDRSTSPHGHLTPMLADIIGDVHTEQEELVKSTQGMEGVVQMQAEENSSASSVKVGSKEFFFEGGDALASHSGLVDHGREDLPGSHYPASRSRYHNVFASWDSGTSHPNEANGKPAMLAKGSDFDMKVLVAKKGTEYLFEILLKPKATASFRRITHNYTFLIDRSHSMPKERFESAKRAVTEAIAHIHPDDRFNIFLFDDKVVKLSDTPLEKTQSNCKRAAQFLGSAPHGGFFASTDLYGSLGKIIPKQVSDSEVNSAILISDGDTFLSRAEQRATIVRWNTENESKVTVFALAAGSGNNLELLDVLSTVTGGALSYCKDHRNLPKTLVSLISRINNPIGKRMSCSAVARSPETELEIYPKDLFLPDLYENVSYAIYGRTSSLEGFHLFLQGRHYDEWVDIKQTVDFQKAQRVPAPILAKQIAVQKAYQLYQDYLDDGHRYHIVEAKKELSPYKLQTAFR